MKNSVAKYRKKKGLEQKELAARVGVTNFHLNRVEKGKAIMSIPLAKRIAEELGVSLNSLLKEEE